MPASKRIGRSSERRGSKVPEDVPATSVKRPVDLPRKISTASPITTATDEPKTLPIDFRARQEAGKPDEGTQLTGEERRIAARVRRKQKASRKVVEVFLELLPTDTEQIARIERFLRGKERSTNRTRIIRLALAAFKESDAMVGLHDELAKRDRRLLANRSTRRTE